MDMKKPNKGISRRGLMLSGMGMAAGAALLPAGCSRNQQAAGAASHGLAVAGRDKHLRNVIFMVADGMSMGVPTLAQHFAERFESRDTTWYRMLADQKFRRELGVVDGLFATSSLTSLVTDSAAACSAWASGSRVINQSLNYLPDGTELTPIGQLLRGQGKRVGLVTTDKIVGATPTGFVISQADRSAYEDIAEKYVGAADVILGGGREYFDQAKRSDKRDVWSQFADPNFGYTRITNRDQLLKARKADQLVGLIADDLVPYTLDVKQSAQMQNEVPTLREMSEVAVEILNRGPNGFFVMIEGGRVDHAAHYNDAAAIIQEQLAFDEAVTSMVEWVSQRDDTLLIVTSDHGNSNPGLVGMGGGYLDSTKHFDQVAKVKASAGVILKEAKAQNPTPDNPDAVVDVMKKYTDITLTRDEARQVAATLDKLSKPDEVNIFDRSAVGMLGQVLTKYLGIGWVSTTHTSDHVLVNAIGPGAEHFAGLHHLTHAYDVIAAMSGIKHKNAVAPVA